METLSEMQNDCKTFRKLEEKIGKEKYIVMNYNTDWNNKNLPSRAKEEIKIIREEKKTTLSLKRTTATA